MARGSLIQPLLPGNSLAAGETQEINVNYEVEDSGGLNDTNSFPSRLTAPTTRRRPFTTAQSCHRRWNGCQWPADSLDPDPVDADGNATASYKLIGAPIDGLTIDA